MMRTYQTRLQERAATVKRYGITLAVGIGIGLSIGLVLAIRAGRASAEVHT